MNASASESILRISNLEKSYGNFKILRKLQLEVAAGAIHGLVGLNGSGKTTTLECVLGLQSFNSGEISLLDKQPQHLHLHKGKVVAIFDSPSLNPNLTVRQTLQHAALLCDQPESQIKKLESLLGIENFRHFKIRNLSLGNKRRTSIAQGLIGDPELVLLDEPFNGLDAGGVDDVLQLISDLNREQGTTFLLSSHQLPYLEQVCSHIAILHEGKIAISGTKAALLQNSEVSLHIRTSDNVRAAQVIDQLSSNKSRIVQTGKYLVLTDLSDSAENINKALVENDIGVSEIIQQQASLETLFRKLTSGVDS